MTKPRVEVLPIEQAATPDPGNVNKHTQKGGGLLENSLRKRGAFRSIASAGKGAETPVVYAGNYTLEKAVSAGFKEVVNVHVTGDQLVNVVRDDIAPGTPEAIALGIEDNEIGKQSYSPDIDLLAALAAGDNALLSALKKEDKTFGGMLEGMGVKEETQDAEPQIDRAAELLEKWGVKTGDLWKIGAHRLLCGDSTKREDVERVMGGEKAQLFATDPPYGANAGNIGFTAQRDDIEVIKKDDLEGTDMQAFLESCFKVWIPNLADNCAWYLWHPMLTQGYFAAAAAAAAAALIIHRQIIWEKEQFIFGRGDYHWRHELCFYGWRSGNRPPFYGKRNQDTVWKVPWGEKRSDVGHPTAKPPELFAIPMRNHTKNGELCAEPFAGSGSQFLSGENEGRRVYGIEIDPKYVAVCLERMSQAFPGIEIHRENTDA